MPTTSRPNGPSPSSIAMLPPTTLQTSSTRSPPRCLGPSRPSRSPVAPSSWLSSNLPAQPKAIPLYLLPPRSPKLNRAVERCNVAWRYEFYAVVDLPHDIDKDTAEHVDAFQQPADAESLGELGDRQAGFTRGHDLAGSGGIGQRRRHAAHGDDLKHPEGRQGSPPSAIRAARVSFPLPEGRLRAGGPKKQRPAFEGEGGAFLVAGRKSGGSENPDTANAAPIWLHREVNADVALAGEGGSARAKSMQRKPCRVLEKL